MDRPDYGNNAVAVVPGLGIGIAFIVVFAFLFSNTSVTLPEKPSYPSTVRVEGLSGKVHHVGAELDILVRIEGTASSCSYPTAVITNTDTSEILWDSGIRLVVCDPDPDRHPVNIVWLLGESYTENGATSLQNPIQKIIPTKAGNYSLTITYDEIKSTAEFTVYP